MQMVLLWHRSEIACSLLLGREEATKLIFLIDSLACFLLHSFGGEEKGPSFLLMPFGEADVEKKSLLGISHCYSFSREGFSVCTENAN